MNEPTTTLDDRFSDPEAEPTSWDEAVRIIEGAQLFWISTVRADSRPHMSPVVAVWLEGALHFCTGAAEQKALNLAAHSHVILSTGCNEWDRGIDVVVEGEAIRVTDDMTLERLADAWRRKWDGRWEFAAREGCFHQEGGEALVFSVVPTKVLTFGKGTFTHTSHRFDSRHGVDQVSR